MNKIDELKKKYRELLRAKDLREATKVANEMKKFRKDYEESSEEEVVEDDSDIVEEDSEDEDDFTELNGVGDELAGMLKDKYGSFDNLRQASVEDLEPIPGIGVKRAESLLEQLREE